MCWPPWSSRASARDVPTYLVDGNIGNALGERFDSGE